jgi:DNA-binding MarR family transcriptional regulator
LGLALRQLQSHALLRMRNAARAEARRFSDANVSSIMADPMSSSSAPRFTEKQGQYLAFISTYTLLNRRPPAEADFQRFFQVTPPTIHQMIVELERRGLISRVPGQPRTIKVTLPDDELPRLQPIKTTATRY